MKKCAIILCVLSILTFAIAGVKLFLAVTHPIKYQNEIKLYAKEFGLPASVVASVINIESSYNKNAKSNKDAIGLMQIKLTTANYINNLNNLPSLTEEELFKPNVNIKYGCMYLRYLLNKFKNLETALCAYNAGETNVRNWLNSDFSNDGKTLNYIPFNETRNYLIKFKSNLKYYKKIY